MPEWSELKIMSEYINRVSEGKTFVNIRKSDVSKIKTDLKGNWTVGFCLRAQSRGKELKLEFSWKPKCFKEHLQPNTNLICSMGMSGNWVFTETDKTPKHAHLMFDTNDGWTLSLVDTRRFAKWKWSEGWSTNRGPDPIDEFNDFVSNVVKNLNKKEFNKPIYEVLLNQEYFSGIGNYLRGEILYRIDGNPFLSAKEYILKHSEILIYCKRVPTEAYTIGGGQLKEWTNPFKADKITFKEWLKCYGNKNMATIIDKKGRKFWFDKKHLIHL